METNYIGQTCREFTAVLASKAPTPGGGGASALCGAMGAALGEMVINLTLGKRKYAHVEAELLELQKELRFLQSKLLRLVDEDARAFTPLSQAYGLPSATEEEAARKQEALEAALYEACQPPLDIMAACARVICLIEAVAEKGSVMALSDAGVGANFCLCALESASLNIWINTKSMKDRAIAEQLESRTQDMLERYRPIAEAIAEQVTERLKAV